MIEWQDNNLKKSSRKAFFYQFTKKLLQLEKKHCMSMNTFEKSDCSSAW